MKLRIAVVQFEIKQFSPNKNLKKAENFIKKASKEKADIIVFPEDFLTGGITKKEIDTYADSNKKYRTLFQELARKYKIDLVAGSILEKEWKGFYNVCYYINSAGKIKGKYKKINLWWTEREHISPGNEICVFNTRYGKIGLIICWDLMFPEIFRRRIKKGARIIFCPSLWYKGINFKPYQKLNPNAEKEHVNTLCKTRAVENNIFLIYANAIGMLKNSKEKVDEAIGQSQITAPIKGVLKKAKDKTEMMFIQEITTDILKDAERAFGIRKDLKNRF